MFNMKQHLLSACAQQQPHGNDNQENQVAVSMMLPLPHNHCQDKNGTNQRDAEDEAIVNVSTILVSTLADITCTVFLLTIVVSYIMYGVGFGFWPLPTISTTWDFPPASYLSRIVVGLGSTSFALLHLTIYYSTQHKTGASALLFIGLMGSLCLALVGAICSSNQSPECMGQQEWHSTCAVTFFLLQDIFQVTISLRDKAYKSAIVMMIVSLAVLYGRRNMMMLGGVITADQGGVAEFEWANVFAIFGFMVAYVHTNCINFQIGFFAMQSRRHMSVLDMTNDPQLVPQWLMSGTLAGGITAAVGIVLIIVAYSIASARGDFPSFPQYTPEISAVFIYAPSNYLARFFGVQGANGLAIFLVMAIRVMMMKGGSGFFTTFPERLGYVMVVTCAVFLALSLCVNNVENHDIHLRTVAIFFATFTVLLVLWFAPGDARSAVFAVLSVMSKIRFILPMDWSLMFNRLELFDVMCGLIWVALFAWFHSSKMGKENFGLVMMRTAEGV